MDECTILAAPSDLSAKYEDHIRETVKNLMLSNGYSQSQLCRMFKERGIALGQGNLSSMLSGVKHIPLSLLVHLCDIFKVSLPELAGENFGGSHQVGSSSPIGQVFSSDLLQLIPDLGDSFITDPQAPEFHGYLQTYYFYMQPTRSYETKLLTGTMTLKACGTMCEASLDLNTQKVSGGVPLHKQYQGRVVISKSIDAVYILLTSAIEGEMNIISFRHFHLPHQPLDCRIAAVLTNETGEFHAPTMHRMFLSRTPIKPEHLPLLLPHLRLNRGSIEIPADRLDRLRRNAPEYAELLNVLTIIPASETFFWTEDYILGVAKHFLSKEEIPVFFSRIREISLNQNANKASRKADSLARELLISLGYYRDNL